VAFKKATAYYQYCFLASNMAPAVRVPAWSRWQDHCGHGLLKPLATWFLPIVLVLIIFFWLFLDYKNGS
jgi:hypothetical protein